MTAGIFPLALENRITELSGARGVLLDRLAGHANPVGNSLQWSIAEIAFHLHLTETNIGRLLRKIVARGERREPAGQDHLRAEWDRVRELVGTRGTHVSAPSFVQPHDAPSLPEATRLLSQSRQQLLEILSPMTLDDLASVSAPHPVPAVGVLTGASWISVIAYHELRHARQIDDLRRAFPGPGNST
jgi:hypothetical protein